MPVSQTALSFKLLPNLIRCSLYRQQRRYACRIVGLSSPYEQSHLTVLFHQIAVSFRQSQLLRRQRKRNTGGLSSFQMNPLETFQCTKRNLLPAVLGMHDIKLHHLIAVTISRIGNGNSDPGCITGMSFIHTLHIRIGESGITQAISKRITRFPFKVEPRYPFGYGGSPLK